MISLLHQTTRNPPHPVGDMGLFGNQSLDTIPGIKIYKSYWVFLQYICLESALKNLANPHISNTFHCANESQFMTLLC